MVVASEYVIYSNTPSHTRALWAKIVDATHVFLIYGAKYFTLNEGWLRFEPVIFCHIDFWYHVKEPTQPKV